MTDHFLVGAILGSALGIFGLGGPLRRAMQQWRERQPGE